MFIDVAECPHSSGVVTGQNTSGTLNLNRWLYLRSKMDDIVAKLSGGGNCGANYLFAEGGILSHLKPNRVQMYVQF